MTSTAADHTDVHVKHHPSYGTSLYASRSFAAAEVVVCEEALLLSRPVPHSTGDQLVHTLQAACLAATQETPQPLKPSAARWKDACEKVVAFLAAPAHTQQIVLQEMDATLDSNSPLSAMCQLFAQVISQELPALLDSPRASQAPSPQGTCPSDDAESAGDSEFHSNSVFPACGPACQALNAEESLGLSPPMQPEGNSSQGTASGSSAGRLWPAGSSTGLLAGPDSHQPSSSTAGLELLGSKQHSSLTGPPGSDQPEQYSSTAGVKPPASGQAGVSAYSVMSQNTIHAVLRAFEVNAHSTKQG